MKTVVRTLTDSALRPELRSAPILANRLREPGAGLGPANIGKQTAGARGRVGSSPGSHMRGIELGAEHPSTLPDPSTLPAPGRRLKGEASPSTAEPRLARSLPANDQGHDHGLHCFEDEESHVARGEQALPPEYKPGQAQPAAHEPGERTQGGSAHWRSRHPKVPWSRLRAAENDSAVMHARAPAHLLANRRLTSAWGWPLVGSYG